MFRLLVFSLLSTIVHCSCPPGFYLVANGQCRELRPRYQADLGHDVITETAVAKCAEIQAQPVIIHSDEEQNYWKSHHDVRIVLGMECNMTSMRWQWVDGSVPDYSPPEGILFGDFNAKCTTGCGWYLYGAEPFAGQWFFYCDNLINTYNIYCTKQLPPQPAPSGDGCESFEDDYDDAVCYQIGTTAESWQEAQQICTSFGADLASIHNLQENSFIRRLAVSKGALSGLFLGAIVSGKGDEFGWIDGSNWDYDNFAAGYPNSGSGNCIAMNTQDASGQWVNVNCNSKLSVACVRPQNSQPPLDCQAGPWREGEIIYSPGFPIDASTPCDFIFTVDAGKKVQLEILLLEANTCCDHLMLYNDSGEGNPIANLTGEISERNVTSSSNTMRVSWQPNGGVNVRGVMMTYRSV